MSVRRSQQVSHFKAFDVKNEGLKIVILSVRGNKSKGQISWRVDNIDDSGSRVDDMDVFWILVGLCEQVGCGRSIGPIQ